MQLVKVEQVPLRLAIGAYILNSGITKQGADEETAVALQGFAARAFPFVRNVTPQQFVRLLAGAEITLGTAILVPAVPAAVAGTGLTAFAGGLVGLYLRTPGMRREGSLRPTEQGVPLAKDVWMLGAGLTLLLDDLIDRCGRRRGGQVRS
ncbi:MAG: hypothetical protein ACRDPK_19885 [Carbonactinosporaceae bacterium]